MFPIQQFQRSGRLFLDRLMAAHRTHLFFQGGKLIFLDLRIIDLIEDGRQFVKIIAVIAFLEGIIDLSAQPVIVLIGLVDLVEQRIVSIVSVQQGQVIARLQQILVVVLRVDVDQSAHQLSQKGSGTGTLRDPDRALSLCADLTGYDQIFPVQIKSLFSQERIGTRIIVNVENAFDDCFRAAFFDITGRCSLPAQQRDGIDQQRFTRAGLAGEHAHAIAEIQCDLIDQHEVFYIDVCQQFPSPPSSSVSVTIIALFLIHFMFDGLLRTIARRSWVIVRCSSVRCIRNS